MHLQAVARLGPTPALDPRHRAYDSGAGSALNPACSVAWFWPECSGASERPMTIRMTLFYPGGWARLLPSCSQVRRSGLPRRDFARRGQLAVHACQASTTGTSSPSKWRVFRVAIVARCACAMPAINVSWLRTLQDEVTTLQREKAALQHQLDLLCQRLFGKKSERVSPDQLRLAFAQLANEASVTAEPIEMDSGERPGRPRRRATDRSPADVAQAAAGAG